jgi:hypothetical protein
MNITRSKSIWGRRVAASCLHLVAITLLVVAPAWAPTRDVEVTNQQIIVDSDSALDLGRASR